MVAQRNFNRLLAVLTVLTALALGTVGAQAEHANVRYGVETVDDLDIFYREAGDPANPVIVLLHGFPTSSRMYRDVLEGLSDDYYLIAPDYPGFGNSSYPQPDVFTYTFDSLSDVIDKFLVQRGLKLYSMMVQDYGAPIGFRIATAHPERVQSIITQNGNVYEEGATAETFGPVGEYWKTRTPELEQIITENILSLQSTIWQYTHGTRNPESISPDSWNLDFAKMSREGQTRMHLDLFYDYQNNLTLYPVWQQYLRDEQPPVLVVWGKNDPIFPAPGAEAFKKDVKDLDFNLFDTGHFALEEDHVAIVSKMRQFLQARGIQ